MIICLQYHIETKVHSSPDFGLHVKMTFIINKYPPVHPVGICIKKGESVN